ncbi:ribonuclease H-like domain-containing protein [Rhizophagus irregularis DAOM 181602=DAOM 197198]|uniref:Uncharacterized protein n=1 Tax=Rhizophagus irregularis (strain DAOM 181602 / DAOM 197198 / MUCL 43194) TaxID=747089 RepID=U9T065_RHIID|nr:ribonuclease H-like domain-containing protein [Rhizophagus irregularis DAOM 181602=DAOM 197198]
MWNNNVPIDRDVRKCIEATASQLINWTCTSKWFNYNGHDEATSSQHCKDTAWKIRCFTKTLTTLDILNRKFPKLINNVCCINRRRKPTTTYGYVLNLIKLSAQIANSLIKILNQSVDKSSLCISDSGKY